MPLPGDFAAPSAGTRTELAIEVVEEFLGAVPLFSKCDPAAVSRILPRIVAYDFAAGASIVSAGEQAKWLGVLFRGKASVRTIDAATGTASVIETLRVGDHFGDVGALLGTGQPFAVVAEDAVTVLLVPEPVVGELATKVAGFGYALARRLSTRLLQASVQTVRRPVAGASPGPALGAAPRTLTPLPPTPALWAARRAGTPAPAVALVFEGLDQERDDDEAARVSGEDVSQLANRILLVGIEREASDVHLEPDGGGMKVRLRVEGTLVDGAEVVAPAFVRPLVARFKALAGLDVDERRRPQDGRIGLRAGRRELDVRVSTMPASRGETLVLRLREAAAMIRPLEQVFLEPAALDAVRAAVERPSGVIVVAGPTGSGRTASLYALLAEGRRTRPEASIVTIEDPVEVRLLGVTQVQADVGVGLTIPALLRASLRQDPDVLVVGEVRDAETARLALEAAMSGHLLLTSMHAASAAGVLQGLLDLGASRALVAQALSLVVVQRLARRLCPSCASTEVPAPPLVDALVARGLAEGAAPGPVPRAVGCEACRGTGHLGRVAIVETLSLGDELRAALLAGTPLVELERRARQTHHLFGLPRAAASLMARGLITPAAALRVVAE